MEGCRVRRGEPPLVGVRVGEREGSLCDGEVEGVSWLVGSSVGDKDGDSVSKTIGATVTVGRAVGRGEFLRGLRPGLFGDEGEVAGEVVEVGDGDGI